jgi:predicted amidophosphoribosyltransferase
VVTSTARHRRGPSAVAAGWAELAELVLARDCGGCGRPGTPWCAGCAQQLVAAPRRRVLPSGLVVWSATAYEQGARSAVVAWKDRGRADLTGPLAVGLRPAASRCLGGQPLERQPLEGLVLVPVPSSRAARRVRGHEPVRDLARATAGALRRRGVDVRPAPALRQLRPVADQAGLGLGGRGRNLAGALGVPPGWRRSVSGRRVLLVDDVVTTGSTLQEASRALEEVGARVLGAATVASTGLRGAQAGAVG